MSSRYLNKRVEWFRAPGSFEDAPLVLLEPNRVTHRVMKEIKGFDTPSFDFASFVTPGVDGVRFGDVTASRSLIVPVLVTAASRAEMRDLKANIAAAMNPKNGPGRLLMSEAIGEESGASRYVTAMYRGGLQGDGTQGGLANWWRFDLDFECVDPYWYDYASSRAVWAGKAGVPFFPFTPNAWGPNPYGVDVLEELYLTGNAEAWPTFTLSGPWSRVRFRNDMSGKWWELRRPAYSSETLVVTTKPGEVSVRNLAGDNRYGFAAGSELFPLTPWTPPKDADTVSVEADGLTVDSRFEMVVNSAWLTAP